MSRDILMAGLRVLEDRAGDVQKLRAHWRGDSPAAFLTAKSREALDSRLRRLGVNFPRLVVSSLADRLNLGGMLFNGQPSMTWGTFVQCGGRQLAELIHSDRLLFGSAYVTVWADEAGRPTVTGDSPATMAHYRDPATGTVEWAVRRWETPTGERAAVYTADSVQLFASRTKDTPSGSSSWKKDRTVDNPLDAVPVVPFVRRLSLSDPPTGASAVSDVLDLSDAISKLLSDAMVTSEFYARPRRWATGLEIEEDEDGNPVDPFGEGRFLQSESPETKFGQLEPARLDGYADLIATLTQQIGSLTGLPPHYLGLHGDQPANAEGVKAAETQLVVAAYAEQRQLSGSWSDVAWLLDAVDREVPVDPDLRRVWSVDWRSPEIRTIAQAADAAGKLRDMGLPLDMVMRDVLDMDPDVVQGVTFQSV